MSQATHFAIRPAKAADDAAIKGLVRSSRINPTGLDWRRFVVAEADGAIVGTGQVKPHRDGTRELASIAVAPSWQGHGIARAIITELVEREGSRGTQTLYLICRDRLEPFYQKFGFARVSLASAPASLARMLRLGRLFAPLARVITGERISGIVMCREF